MEEKVRHIFYWLIFLVTVKLSEYSGTLPLGCTCICGASRKLSLALHHLKHKFPIFRAFFLVWYYLLSQFSRLHECLGKSVDEWPPVPRVSMYLPVLSWIRFLCIQSCKAGTVCQILTTRSNSVLQNQFQWRSGASIGLDSWEEAPWVRSEHTLVFSVGDPWHFGADPDLDPYLWLMKLFFIEFKDARKKIFFVHIFIS